MAAEQFDSDYTMGVKILDSPQDQVAIERLISEADGIILTYNSNTQEFEGKDLNEKKKNQRESIKNWLLKIRKARGDKSKRCPVILAGTKTDERGQNYTEWDNLESKELEENVNPILIEFPEVELCVECSSKLLINVQAVFNNCHKEIAYPISVLYNSDTEVLVRIFFFIFLSIFF